MAMMAITTNNSISVNPEEVRFFFIISLFVKSRHVNLPLGQAAVNRESCENQRSSGPIILSPSIS